MLRLVTYYAYEPEWVLQPEGLEISKSSVYNRDYYLLKVNHKEIGLLYSIPGLFISLAGFSVRIILIRIQFLVRVLNVERG